jgi:hypothetical protein
MDPDPGGPKKCGYGRFGFGFGSATLHNTVIFLLIFYFIPVVHPRDILLMPNMLHDCFFNTVAGL